MRTTINISKAALLQATNQGLDFYQFAIPSMEKLDDEHCESTYNPFYDDRNPSFSIYFSKKAVRWMFKDHGNAPDGKVYAGDVFVFAKLFYERNGFKLNFGALMAKIAEDLAIDPAKIEDKTEARNLANYQRCEENGELYRTWNIGFDFFSDASGTSIEGALTYFSQYGISKEALLRYNVTAVKKYLYIDKKGILQRRTYSDRLVIAYQDAAFSKMYSPEPKAFWYVGTKPKDHIFGFNQLLNRNRREKNYDRDILIITGGEKDVLTLASLGYDAVCFNSETADIPQLATETLFHWYKRIIVMYDDDFTGKARTCEIVSRLKANFSVTGFKWGYNLSNAGGKDVSDYIKLGLSIDKLREQVISGQQETESADLLGGQVTEEQSIAFETPSDEDYTPFLSEKVYQDLPDFLKQLCDQFPDRKDKDILLLSALTVVSSMFPTVYGEYGRARVGANIYLFVSGPSAAGKGVMQWSRELGVKVQGYLKQKFVIEMRNYEVELMEYSSGGNPDAPKPVKPEQQIMFIPANTSTSKVIQFLGANRNFGVIMETEADTLAAAFKNDWGDFSYVLRNAFHHETVQLSRRGKDEYIEIERPQLSVLLSGTFNQIGNLLSSVENGLFSRFLFYEFKAPNWKSQFIKQDGNSLAELFEMAGNKMLGWWEQHYIEKDSVVHLQPHHESILDQHFEKKFHRLGSEYGEPIEASVKRACLICYRIAIILTVIRTLANEQWLPATMFVEDADFECALRIVDTLLYHLQKVYSRLENSSRTSKLKVQPRALYNALPEEFTRGQYDTVAETLKIKYKTAERYLDSLFKEKLLERYEQGKYRKL